MDASANDLLSQWKLYLTNISSNLMEVTDQIEYQMIKQRALDKTKGYRGTTAKRAEDCVELVGKLWRQFVLLSEVMERAAALSGRKNLIYNPEEDIRELFERTRIVVDEEHVDISRRNLLDDDTDEKMATPKELLKEMKEGFEKLCRGIKEISDAEKSLQRRLEVIKKDIASLNSTAGKLGISDVPVFDTERVGELERDPLKGIMELDKLVYSVEKFRASIRTIEEDYNKASGELERTREMLSELNGLAEKSSEALKQSLRIFGSKGNVRPVISSEIIKSLEDWLKVLEKKISEGNLRAVKVGVSRLVEECSIKLEHERENYSINSREYNEWIDLKGQLKALIAKAEVLKSKGLLFNGSIDELIKKAQEALNSDTVNLDVCRELVGKVRLSL